MRSHPLLAVPLVPKALLLACLLQIIPGAAQAGPAVDSAPYANILSKHVRDDGLVDYRGLKSDQQELGRYLAAVAALDPGTVDALERDDAIAFWINVYNAITLDVIISNYPIESRFFASLVYPKNSIRQIPGVWDREKHKVAGMDLTLDQIEHEILRKKFKEPRIHMALVCASMGCPPLRNEPYVGAELSQQLDDQARRFLASENRFRLDRIGKHVFLSPIFDWFSEDFITAYGSDFGWDKLDKKSRAALRFVAQYLSRDESAFLSAAQLSVTFLDYDWSLNEAPKR